MLYQGHPGHLGSGRQEESPPQRGSDCKGEGGGRVREWKGPRKEEGRGGGGGGGREGRGREGRGREGRRGRGGGGGQGGEEGEGREGRRGRAGRVGGGGGRGGGGGQGEQRGREEVEVGFCLGKITVQSMLLSVDIALIQQ